MKNVTENLPQQIRFLRELQGYSQEAIASFLGISQQAYQKIESGKCKICQERLIEIAKFFDLDADRLAHFNKDDFLSYLKKDKSGHSLSRMNLKRKAEAISREIVALKKLNQQLLNELS